MNPEIKAEWVAALKSGEYFQGKGHLCHEDSAGRERHCCLGVLSELAVKAGVSSRRLSSLDAPVIAFDDTTGFLPKSIQEWAGLDSESPSVPADSVNDTKTLDAIDGQVSLAGLNDAGVPFGDIARLIEIHL